MTTTQKRTRARDSKPEQHETTSLMRSAAAAKYLSIGERSLWALTKARLIAHVRIGHLVRYRREDLDQYIAGATISRRRAS